LAYAGLNLPECHCEELSDKAISVFYSLQIRLLRFARNATDLNGPLSPIQLNCYGPGLNKAANAHPAMLSSPFHKFGHTWPEDPNDDHTAALWEKDFHARRGRSERRPYLRTAPSGDASHAPSSVTIFMK
jgi:hypothetical protein